MWEKGLNPCQHSALGLGLTVDNRRANIRKQVDNLVIKSYPQVVKAIAHKYVVDWFGEYRIEPSLSV